LERLPSFDVSAAPSPPEEEAMVRINWARVVGGGLLSGLVANVLEMLYGFVMRSQ
jgi:hypothetical protein